jgi:hypothetical protein
MTEQVVTMPVVNPDTGKPSRSFVYAGKIDLIDGDTLVDWKSVSDPEHFIQQKTIGFQGELYALALEAAGTPIARIIYRLITKPTIKFCGKDANRDAYEQRCVEWLQDPGRLQEHEVVFNAARLNQARLYLWEISKAILESRRHDRWLCNEYACKSWNRTCEYAPLCMAASLGSDYQCLMQHDYKASALHEELGVVEPQERDLLTYSAAATYAHCAMKYFWRYHLGIKRRDETGSEALWIGSAMHAGFEAVTEGVDAALVAIDEWARKNPVLGQEAAQRQEQQVAQARAMVRAAIEKWPF